MVESSVSRQFNTENLEVLVEDARIFIDRIQYPVIRDVVWLQRMQHTGEDLANKLAGFAALAGEKHAETCDLMKKLAEHLRVFAGELASHPSPGVLKEHRDMLARHYEELLLELKKRRMAGVSGSGQSLQLKPTNYMRNIVHASLGLIGVTLYYLFLTHAQALFILGSLLTVFTVLEVTRRLSTRWNDFLVDRVFKAIVRPSERYRVNSATIYLLALTLIVWLFPKLSALAATLVLSFGDPVASLAGKRWGRRKLFRDKSVVGSLAFIAAGAMAVVTLLILAEPGMGMARVAAVSVAIAFAGALTELFSTRIDDNFSVPVVCAIIATLLL